MVRCATAGPATRVAAGPVSGIILAAGASRRMGVAGPKQLVRYKGRYLLEHAIEAANGSGLAETVVVLGHEATAIAGALGLSADGPLRAVVSEDSGRGVSASLKAGLLAVDANAVAVCVLLGDQPGLAPDMIDRVVTAGAVSERPALRPVYDDGVPGHPVWLARRLWPEVFGLSGDQGLRSLFADRPELLEELGVEGAPPPDIDRMDDLQGPV